MRASVTGLVQDMDDNSLRSMYIPASLIDNINPSCTVKYAVSEKLANSDINYLTAWYKHYTSTEGSRPVLLAALHDFDPTVMQDVFYICG
jgi:hypothetical protein